MHHDPHAAVRAHIEVHRDTQLTCLEELLDHKNRFQKRADEINAVLAAAVAAVITCEQQIQAFEAWLAENPEPNQGNP